MVFMAKRKINPDAGLQALREVLAGRSERSHGDANFAMAVRMVAADRVKLTLEDEYVARYYLARESPKVRNAVEFLPKPLSENSLHILVSLKNPQHEQIVAGFDKAIAAMKADGSYARLLRQHGF